MDTQSFKVAEMPASTRTRSTDEIILEARSLRSAFIASLFTRLARRAARLLRTPLHLPRPLAHG